ncbi:hypothetical protein [Qipengyuania flava]|uniref:hypothetical protein n=1 Tax=Qipengyuania flava TaxID=192812 RepID=UPI001C633622|nr:hypothetical protein [Qipengyuania flava]QYJ07017.1 hypothetical protein KUV82_13395 [Qipengyuania flava]
MITAGVVLAGAESGTAIGSMPVMSHQAGFAFERPAARAPQPAPPPVRQDLPNHYPLVTPNGTIPVAALALHGRLRGSRDAMWDEPGAVALRADYGEELSEFEIDRLANGNGAVRSVGRDRTVRVHTADDIRIEIVDIEDRPGWPVAPD